MYSYEYIHDLINKINGEFYVFKELTTNKLYRINYRNGNTNCDENIIPFVVCFLEICISDIDKFVDGINNKDARLVYDKDFFCLMNKIIKEHNKILKCIKYTRNRVISHITKNDKEFKKNRDWNGIKLNSLESLIKDITSEFYKLFSFKLGVSYSLIDVYRKMHFCTVREIIKRGKLDLIIQFRIQKGNNSTNLSCFS